MPDNDLHMRQQIRNLFTSNKGGGEETLWKNTLCQITGKGREITPIQLQFRFIWSTSP